MYELPTCLFPVDVYDDVRFYSLGFPLTPNSIIGLQVTWHYTEHGSLADFKSFVLHMKRNGINICICISVFIDDESDDLCIIG